MKDKSMTPQTPQGAALSDADFEAALSLAGFHEATWVGDKGDLRALFEHSRAADRRLTAEQLCTSDPERHQQAQTDHAAEQGGAETVELEQLRATMADILSRTAVALRGPEPPRTRWGWHDLPERAAAAIAALGVMQKVAVNLADTPEPEPAPCEVCGAAPCGWCDPAPVTSDQGRAEKECQYCWAVKPGELCKKCGSKKPGGLLAAARALLDAVDANHERPVPLKYTVPYGAVNALRAALTHLPSAAEQGGAPARMNRHTGMWEGPEEYPEEVEALGILHEDPDVVTDKILELVARICEERDSARAALTTQPQAELAERDKARYLKAFRHIHVRSSDDPDRCAQCKLDIRDEIHATPTAPTEPT